MYGMFFLVFFSTTNTHRLLVHNISQLATKQAYIHLPADLPQCFFWKTIEVYNLQISSYSYGYVKYGLH